LGLPLVPDGASDARGLVLSLIAMELPVGGGSLLKLFGSRM
jgi:hypothetical protein